MDNKLVKRKIQTYEIILCIFVLAVVAAGLLMPKTGSLVMIDEICDIVAVWTVCIYVIVRIIQSRGRFQASVKSSPDPCHSRMCGDRRTVYGEHGSGSCVRPGDAQLTDIQVSRSQAHYRYLFASLLSDRNGQPGRTCPAGDIGRRLHQTVRKAAASRLNITDIPGGS